MKGWFVVLAIGMAAYDSGRRRGRVETLRSFIRLARTER